MSYLDRLIDEENTLKLKIASLTEFITTEKYWELESKHRSLLSSQLATMQSYLAILEERLKLT